jgi:hypothetical protein
VQLKTWDLDENVLGGDVVAQAGFEERQEALGKGHEEKELSWNGKGGVAGETERSVRADPGFGFFHASATWGRSISEWCPSSRRLLGPRVA